MAYGGWVRILKSSDGVKTTVLRVGSYGVICEKKL